MKQTVLVTGASRGIGKAICQLLVLEGYRVIGVSRTEPDIDHSNFSFVSIDLGDLKQLPLQLKNLKFQLPHVDAIVSNVGGGLFGNLEELSFTQIRSLLDLNFLSHVYLTKTYLAEMKKQKRGDLLFIGSNSGLLGKRKGSIYCASKFALRGFAQALRDECRSDNIRVSLIQPGAVQTSLFDDQSFEPAKEPETHLQPEDVAGAVSMVLSSPNTAVFDEILITPQMERFVHKKKS